MCFTEAVNRARILSNKNSEKKNKIWAKIIILIKIETVSENQHYDKNRKNEKFWNTNFWSKINILEYIFWVKNQNFGQKLRSSSKIKIFVKKQNFCQKSKFLSKIKIFVKNQNFGQQTKLVVENENFNQIKILAQKL